MIFLLSCLWLFTPLELERFVGSNLIKGKSFSNMFFEVGTVMGKSLSNWKKYFKLGNEQLLLRAYRGWQTTQLCGDNDNHFKDLFQTTSIEWNVSGRASFVAHVSYKYKKSDICLDLFQVIFYGFYHMLNHHEKTPPFGENIFCFTFSRHQISIRKSKFGKGLGFLFRPWKGAQKWPSLGPPCHSINNWNVTNPPRRWRRRMFVKGEFSINSWKDSSFTHQKAHGKPRFAPSPALASPWN